MKQIDVALVGVTHKNEDGVHRQCTPPHHPQGENAEHDTHGCEHSHDQAAQVAKLLQKASFDEVFSRQDYAGNDRVTGGKKT